MSNEPPKTPGRAEQPKRERSPKLQSPDADPERNPQDATRKGHCANKDQSARSGMAGGIVPPPDFRKASRSLSATVEETMTEAEALATLKLTNTCVAPDAVASPDQFTGDPPTALWVGESTDCPAVLPKVCEVAYCDQFGEGKAYRLTREGVCLKLALCQGRWCVALVPDKPPATDLRYEPLSLEKVDDGTPAAPAIEAYLAEQRNDSTRMQVTGLILAACHPDGDVGGKPRQGSEAAKKKKEVRLARLDVLKKTLTLQTLRTKMPGRFKDDSPDKYGDPDGVEVGWMPNSTAWPIGTIDGADVAGPPVVKHWRYNSAGDVGKDYRFPMKGREVVSRMLKGKWTNFSETIVTRYVGREDRYDAASRRLGVDVGIVEVVHVAHDKAIRTSFQDIADRKQKEDEKQAKKWEETLAADAAHRASVAAAVAEEHRIASPTVARAATVTPPFSDEQLTTWTDDMWADVKVAEDGMDV